MSKSEHRMIEILRILNKQNKAIGSKLIADELNNKGFNLGERAVRYNMQILDDKGFTEKIGYSGRQITDLGREKLEKGLVYDQVDFTYSKIEEMIYLTDFNYIKQKGNVVVNSSIIYNENSMDILKSIFESNLCVSPFVNLNNIRNDCKIEVKTISGTTIDGILLNEGINPLPQYEGLLKIENYEPIKFTELISYKNTTISPLDALISQNMTSIHDVMHNGTGYIPANFRLIPSECQEKTTKILNELKNIGINGVISISNEGENILGIDVPPKMIGIAIISDITPFCAIKEQNHKIDIKTYAEIQNFKTLSSLTSNNKHILKNSEHNTHSPAPFPLSKSLNLIEKVNFDVEKEEGNIISDISYIEKNNLEEALSIMEKYHHSKSEYINPYYKLVKHPNNPKKIGIATISSLSIDGILINNGIISKSKYGGLLELTDSHSFIELISYNTSSIDPHKIFLAKNMTTITNNNSIRLLASMKEIPYIAREYTMYLLNTLNKIGFSIYKIGNLRESIYNAKVENYNFGVVTGNGLNLIGAIKEKGIEIEIKAIEEIIPFEKMEKL